MLRFPSHMHASLLQIALSFSAALKFSKLNKSIRGTSSRKQMHLLKGRRLILPVKTPEMPCEDVVAEHTWEPVALRKAGDG